MPAKFTQADFVAKAVAAHGVGRYDYSQAAYIGADKKVTIICPEHGSFEQTPRHHANGIRCPHCAGVGRLTQADFLARARAAHGDKYDYSQAVGIGSKRGVTIICPEHGSFEQAANAHMAGQGCAKCYAARRHSPRTTQADFLARARAAHGDKYDYSQAKYRGVSKKITIICPEHGSFEQAPGVHFKGHGCPRCGGTETLTQADFLARARAAHGDKYDYSQAFYKENRTRVTIICPEHGSFEQAANAHMAGRGCWECGKSYAASTHLYTQADFLARARAAHGDKYDYSQAKYQHNAQLIRIGCPQHGYFEQAAGPHMGGSGCKECGKQLWLTGAQGKEALLYFLRIYSESEEFYKVGVTWRSIKRRYGGRSLSGYQYEVLALHKSANATAVWEWEQSILETFAHLSYKPNIHFDGQSECFSSCEEILEIFPL